MNCSLKDPLIFLSIYIACVTTNAFSDSPKRVESCLSLVTKAATSTQPRKNQMTKSGIVFTPVSQEELLKLGVDPKVFGNAWRDPSGLVWGDLVVNEDGSPRYLDLQTAQNFCNAFGARLPSGWPEEQNERNGGIDSDFVRLAKYLGQQTAEGYTPQILPNLTQTCPEPERIVGRSFWSYSSPGGSSPSQYYAFNGLNGELYPRKSDHKMLVLVRCVISTDG